MLSSKMNLVESQNGNNEVDITIGKKKLVKAPLSYNIERAQRIISNLTAF